MTNLLIVGSQILDVGPFSDDGITVSSPTANYPHSAMPGFQIVTTTVPPGFFPTAYTWNGTAVVPTPAPPPPVPQSVTATQAKIALVNANLYQNVNTYMTTSAPAMDQIAWQTATSFQRNDPIVLAMMGPLGISSAQMDALFIAAGQVQT